MKLIRLICLAATALASAFGQSVIDDSFGAQGTAGGGFFQVANQSSAPSTPSSAGRYYFNSGNLPAWIDASGNVRLISGSASALTSGRMPFVTTGGILADAASLTFNSGTGILTATGFAGALNGTVGATTPAAGTFTSVIATGNSAFNVAAGVTPFVELEVDSTSTSSPRGIMTAQFNTGTDGARFHMRKARGTRAAPTTVVTGDNLGRIVGTGYDGSNYLEMASIYFASEGTIAATRVPTNIQFWTATNALPSVLTLAATINSSQQILLGGLTTGDTAGGKLQFPTATTRAGGLTFGNTAGTSDIDWFRSAAGTMTHDATAVEPALVMSKNTTGRIRLESSGVDAYLSASTGALIFRTNGTTGVLTLSATAGTISGGAQNMTLVSGTGNSRTMTLQTTTSGGTATDAIVIGDTQAVTKYKNLTAEGDGLLAIRKVGRITAQTANATICTLTTPAADASYLVSANILITSAIAVSTSINVDYTDESNTARTMILPISGLAGSFVAGGLAVAAQPYESATMHIRTKASTTITISTAAGTFTSVTYNAEAEITQIR